MNAPAQPSSSDLRKKLKLKGLGGGSIRALLEKIVKAEEGRTSPLIRAKIEGLIRKGFTRKAIEERLSEGREDAWGPLVDEIFSKKAVEEEEQIKTFVENKLKSKNPGQLPARELNRLKRRLLANLAARGHDPEKARPLVEGLLP